jgi:hypothetical protein
VRVEAWFGDKPPGDEATARLEHRVASALERDGLVDGQVEVVVVEHPAALPRTPAGKRRPVVTS